MLSKVSDSLILKCDRCLFYVTIWKQPRSNNLLSSENNLLESMTLWIKSEFEVDANPVLNNRALVIFNLRTFEFP